MKEPGKRPVDRGGAEAGSILVETAATAALVAVLIAVLAQTALAAYTSLLASHAARVGAHALSLHADVAEAVEDELPQAWRERTSISTGEDWVEVTVAVPLLVPGAASVARITGYAGALPEPEPAGGTGG